MRYTDDLVGAHRMVGVHVERLVMHREDDKRGRLAGDWKTSHVTEDASVPLQVLYQSRRGCRAFQYFVCFVSCRSVSSRKVISPATRHGSHCNRKTMEASAAKTNASRRQRDICHRIVSRARLPNLRRSECRSSSIARAPTVVVETAAAYARRNGNRTRLPSGFDGHRGATFNHCDRLT